MTGDVVPECGWWCVTGFASAPRHGRTYPHYGYGSLPRDKHIQPLSEHRRGNIDPYVTLTPSERQRGRTDDGLYTTHLL